MSSLSEIRAKLKQNAERANASSATRTFGDGASYQFWKIPHNTTATIRFLPDGDPDNAFFWTKREIIKMPFAGILGQSNQNVEVQVPCNEMFNGKCPVVEAIRPWWNDPAKKDLARVYWKKVSFIYQGFVVDSELEEEDKPENPIRRFILNKSIHDIILAHLDDDEVEVSPVDYEEGNDFRIIRTKRSEYSNYDTSNFSRKSRGLTQFERDAIEEHGLFTLKEFKGTAPSEDHLAAIAAMMDDSVNGRAFDLNAYGQYYRPFGVSYEAKPSGDVPAQVVRNNAANESATEDPSDDNSSIKSSNAILEIDRKSVV